MLTVEELQKRITCAALLPEPGPEALKEVCQSHLEVLALLDESARKTFQPTESAPDILDDPVHVSSGKVRAAKAIKVPSNVQLTKEKSMGSTPPIPVMADRCPECGEIKLRPGDGTERHGSNTHSLWKCIRCGYWWVDPGGHLDAE